jgi:hypothetical protein
VTFSYNSDGTVYNSVDYQTLLEVGMSHEYDIILQQQIINKKRIINIASITHAVEIGT